MTTNSYRTPAADPLNPAPALAGEDPMRVLALFEPGRSGEAALHEAARVASAAEAELTVVTLAHQDCRRRCCGPSPQFYNLAVCAAAGEELSQAQAVIRRRNGTASFRVLVEGRDPHLVSWAAQQGFDLVLVPRHRLVRGGHRAAGKLRRGTTAEVRVVS